MLLAVDADGKILLAFLNKSEPTTKLSADSTALAFTRIALGPVPDGLTADQVDGAIRATAEYPNLVALISQAISAGIPTSSALPVLESVVTTHSQLTPYLSSHLTFAALRAKALSIASPSATKPSTSMPFTIIDDRIGPLKLPVAIAGSNFDGSAQIINSMQIAWTANSTTPSGGAIPNSTVQLGSNSIAAVLRGQTSWFSLEPVVVPGNNGAGYNLTISQTHESRLTNLIDIERGIFSLVLSALPESFGCEAEVAKALISSDDLTRFSVEVSPESFQKYMRSAKVDLTGPLNWPSVFGKCLPGVAVKALVDFFAPISGLYEAISVVKQFNSTANLSSKVGFTIQHWNSSFPVGVCVSPGEGIVNCATQFTFDPVTPSLIVGAALDPKITALDASGQVTGIPSGLQFSSTDTGQSIVNVDAQTGHLTTVGPGVAFITLLDPSTQVTSFYQATVVDPQISPSAINISVGESKAIKLVDNLGNNVITNGSGISLDWYSFSPPGIATLNPLIGVTGVKAGGTVLSFTNPLSGKSATATVTVGASTYWSGSTSLTSCTIPNAIASSELWCSIGGYGFGSGLQSRFAILEGSPANNFVHQWQINAGTSTFQTGLSLPTFSNMTTDFSFLIQKRYDQGGGSILYDEQVPVKFTVIQRLASTISGTYSLEFPYVVVCSTQTPCPLTARGTASGTWSATLRQGQFPFPTLFAGYPFCISVGTALIPLKYNSSPAAGGVYEAGTGSCSFTGLF